jgi:hypothetical protein
MTSLASLLWDLLGIAAVPCGLWAAWKVLTDPWGER